MQESAEREALARLVEAERRAEPSEPPDEERVAAETERRISEAAERVFDEGPSPPAPAPPSAATQPPGAEPPSPEYPAPESPTAPGPERGGPAELTSKRREALLAELRAAEEQLERRRTDEQALVREIEETESRLAAAQRRTAEALDRAAMRLKEAEVRASEAESRAEHAEELAKLKNEEMERESRLQELLDRIAQTEERAAEAERRARETVSRIADVGDEPPTAARPEVPAPPPRRQPEPPRAAPAQPPPPAEPESEPNPTEPEAPTDEATGTARESNEGSPFEVAPLPPQASPPPPESGHPAWIPRPPEAAQGAEAETDQTAALASEPAGERLNLNQASYEDLRRMRLSVTQTGRVLAYRDRAGGFKSLDELDSIPGFPKSFLTELKRRSTV